MNEEKTAKQLRWFELTGGYASALVAAPTTERAIQIATRLAGSYDWQDLGQANDMPGPPTAEGLYHWYGE